MLFIQLHIVIIFIYCCRIYIDADVLPSIINRTASRPRNNRIKCEEENDPSVQINQKKSLRCGYVGHNSKSCQGISITSNGRGKGIGMGSTTGKRQGINYCKWQCCTCKKQRQRINQQCYGWKRQGWCPNRWYQQRWSHCQWQK